MEKKNVIKRPNPLLYWIVVPIGRLIAKIKHKFSYNKDPRIKQIKGPKVVIGTHSCTMDVAFMMISMMPEPLNIVCGKDVFSWGFVKPVFKAAGLIPISQFSMDIKSIRTMKQAIQNGCSLSLFPEGKRSIDGKQLHYIAPSLAKFLKMLDTPVVMCHSNGGYVCSPRWSKATRKGKVTTNLKLLFTKEELETLPFDEIYSRLQKEFCYNDNEYQQKSGMIIKCKQPALGLHYLLYKCPKCQKEYSIISTDKTLECQNCGNIAIVKNDGKIVGAPSSVVFDRLDKWYDYEREEVKKEIEDENFYVSHPVEWYVNDLTSNKYTKNGEGNLYIDTKDIGFEGKDNSGQPYTITIPVKTLHTVVQKTDEAIDLTVKDVVNRFVFTEHKYSAKYNLIVEELFRKLNNID